MAAAGSSRPGDLRVAVKGRVREVVDEIEEAAVVGCSWQRVGIGWQAQGERCGKRREGSLRFHDDQSQQE